MNHYLLKQMFLLIIVPPFTGCAPGENHHLCNPNGRRMFPTHLMEKYIEMCLDFIRGYKLTLINEAREKSPYILLIHIYPQNKGYFR